MFHAMVRNADSVEVVQVAERLKGDLYGRCIGRNGSVTVTKEKVLTRNEVSRARCIFVSRIEPCGANN